MFTSIITAALVINEVMAANVGEAMSPATNFDSWIELYNPGDQAVSLDGMYLSDDAANLKRWRMPVGMGSIPAKGFKVVWLGSNNIKSTQAPFKLDCEGGTIYLSDVSGELLTSQNYPEAMSRTSWARTSDGGDEWGWTSTATPGASNNGALFASERLDPPVVSKGSTVFNGSLQFSVSIPEGALLMYTTDGSLPSAPQGVGQPAGPWTEYVINGNCEGTDATCLISHDADGSGDVERIEDGVGYDGSRGVRVHAIANPEHDYDAQLFIYTPGHVWHSGERFRFSMKVRADKASSISTQTHTTPHNYIYRQALESSYNVGTQWKEITYEGVITDDQVGMEYNWWGEATAKDMQTIAFNLNGDRKENNFYFDDVSWKLFTPSVGADPSQRSVDGQFAVNKTTNYTFRLFKDGYLPSVPVTRSFIKTSDQYIFPVVSIVGDRKYFTDPKWGIDTNGSNGRTGNGQSEPRNYNMDWERPVNFSFITPDGQMVFNQDAEISVSGGWTRSASPRSFKLKSGKEFDGQNHFDYPFFVDKPYIRNKVLLLRNGGNDIWEYNARFTDPALQTIIQRSGIDLDVQCYQPIIEYVNGEFRGVLNLREPNNKKFVEANYGYDDDFIDIFEMSADSNLVFMGGTPDVLNRIYELGARINDDGAYDELLQLLDIDEFTNYMAMELYLGSTDWPHNNIKGFRSQQDGRYRFITFDLDFAFKSSNPFKDFANNQTWTFNYIYDLDETRTEEIKLVTFFLNLLKHDEYRKKFIDTYCLMGGSVFEKTRAVAIVDELAERVRPMTRLDGHNPDRAASNIRSQLNTRMEKMMTCMQGFQQMKLSGVKKQTVMLSADTEGARLYINDLEVPYASFNGRLFAPVMLRATAPAGYRFAGWKQGNNLLSTESTISLPTAASVSLKATFTPLSAEERAQQGLHPVCINEVSASNNIHVNEYWKRNDWVELYNTTSEPIDVEGMYLSDNVDNPLKYQITKGGTQASTIIPAHGYLIIWCDKLEPLSQLHASFKLAAEGGDVLLTAADESWTDRLTYGEMKDDQSAGRYPDGAANVELMVKPTIAKTNLTSSYAVAMEQAYIDGIHDLAVNTAFTARYVVGHLVVRSQADGQVSVNICNLAGQQVLQHSLNISDGYAEMAVNDLPSGTYVALLTDDRGHKASIKFVKS